jgi:nitric oxide reductase large subunit
METTTTKRGFLLAKGWIQAVLLVTLFGFLVMGILAYNIYTGEPPIPATTRRSSANPVQRTDCAPARLPIRATFAISLPSLPGRAWCASTLRPGLNYSYTNNWPEPFVDNHPTADTVVWSVLSLIALLGGIGLLLAAFGRWNFLGVSHRTKIDAC